MVEVDMAGIATFVILGLVALAWLGSGFQWGDTTTVDGEEDGSRIGQGGWVDDSEASKHAEDLRWARGVRERLTDDWPDDD